MLANWVKETTATTGTGTISLGGAAAAHLAFSDRYLDGDYVQYSIVDGNDRETGIGRLTSGTPWTLSRDQVLETLVSGVLTLNPASGLSLSGGAIVAVNTVAQMQPSILVPPGTVDSTAMYQTPPGLSTQQGPYVYGGKAGGEFGSSANVIILMPTVLREAQLITKIFVRCTTANAGENARLMVYSAHPSTRKPDRLLVDSGSIGLGATGIAGNTLASPVVIPPGLIYIADFGDGTTAVCDGCRGMGIEDPIGYNSSKQHRKYGYNSTFGTPPSVLNPANLLIKPDWASFGHFWQ